MELEFFGGIDEIGGNKILLESQESRIFLDFGISYKRSDVFFEFPLLQPSNVMDLIKTGLIPYLNGLYRYYLYNAQYNDTGPTSIVQNQEEKSIDAILLSHAHMDHYGHIGLLREDIPIYSSKITNKMIELYERTGRNTFNVKSEHLDFKDLKQNEEFELGDLIIKRFDVDHSILGASSYFIEGEKKIVYTGDFRLHGNKKNLSEEFLKSLGKENIDYLICEGTRLGKSTDADEKEVEERILHSEEEVKKRCIDIINSEENIVIYDASQADLERVKILSEVAKKTGRELIIDSKKAFLLLRLNEEEPLIDGLPQLDEFKILLGRSKLGSNSTICKDLTESCPDFYLEAFSTGRKNHEKELINDISISEDLFIWGPNLRKKILEHSNEYIIYTSNGPLLLLHCTHDKAKMSGTYIYGKAEPFNEEMEFSFSRLLNWLKLCDLKLEYAHTSGHCFPDDIKRAIEILNPQNIIPIHTEHADEFRNMLPKGTNLIMPKLNKKVIL